MEQLLVKIKSIMYIAQDVLQIVTQKPRRYSQSAGHATNAWKDEKRAISLTSLPENDELEFTIKTFPTYKDATNGHLQSGEKLILHDVFGAIEYKGEGVFIAGGTGVTPIICIFSYLQSMSETGDNKLIFANKTKSDVILMLEFKKILGENYINILSGEIPDEYTNGVIGENLLKVNITDFSQQFFICGPPPMMKFIKKQLAGLDEIETNFTIEEMQNNQIPESAQRVKNYKN